MKDVPNWTSLSTELVPSPVALLLILPSLSAAVISSGLHPWQPPRPRKNNTQREKQKPHSSEFQAEGRSDFFVC